MRVAPEAPLVWIAAGRIDNSDPDDCAGFPEI
jgi:hypothetical protein